MNRAFLGGAVLSRVDAPLLAEVSGLLDLTGNQLSDVAFPSLSHVPELSIAPTPGSGSRPVAEARLQMPLLTSIGILSIQGAGFTSISLPSLVSATFLALVTMPHLTAVRLPQLETSQRIVVVGNAVLELLDLPLRGAAEHLEVRENPALRVMDAMVGVTRLDRVIISDHLALETLMFPSLAEVGWLTVSNNAALVTMAFPALVTAESVHLVDNAQIPGLEGLGALTRVTQALMVSYNASLRTLGLSALTFVNALTVTHNPQLPQCLALALRDGLLQLAPPGLNTAVIMLNDPACP